MHYLSCIFRSSHRRCSVKKGVLSQNSQENTCTKVSFLIKLQASEHLFYISPPDDYFWIFAIFVTLINRARKCKLFRLGYGIWNLEINAKLTALVNFPLFRAIFKTLKQLLGGFISVLILMLPSKHLSWWSLSPSSSEEVLKTSSDFLIKTNIFALVIRLQNMSWSRPIYSFWPYIFKTSWRRLPDVFKTSSRRLARYLQDVFKTHHQVKLFA